MSEGYGTHLSVYKAAGWQGIVPLDGKHLIPKGVTGKGGRWPTQEEYEKWETQHANKNLALVLPNWLCGIDVDAYEGKEGRDTLEIWEHRHGPLPPTWRSSARDDGLSGIYYFKIPEDTILASELGPGVEIVQHHHRYSVVWPSRHPLIGTTYLWYNPMGQQVYRVPMGHEFATLPDTWLEALRAGKHRQDVEGGAETTSMLSKLLNTPPAEAGGRNNWMTRVAGHIAKGKFFEDGFEQLLLTINRALDEPLPELEVIKTAKSIWSSEQMQREERTNMPTQETGWLVGNNNEILLAAKVEKDSNPILVSCSDFDIQVIGKYTDDRFNTYYKTKIVSQLTSTPRFITEPAAMFGDPKTMRKRLQGMELNMWPVRGDVGATESMHPMQRLGHYLSSQQAPTLKVVPCMGWHDEALGFVCDEGVISARGVDEQSLWVLDPAVRNRDPVQNKYGFEGSLEEAQKILKEVLTFQDETVVSVFGAWWAACLMKAQIMHKVAGFPFMAIEATSGTGKTEGFFNLMVQLNGATRLGSHQTAAAFRDSMASNRSGIVWIDDLDNATLVYQDIRTATTESTRSKKAADNTSTASVRLVAPVLLTGESLPGLTEQTALIDRMILLDVPPAKDRRSVRGDYEQWLDILDLREKAPELWKYSGWFVQQALIHASDILADWKALRPEGMSRQGDKVAVLKAGARLLDILCGDGNTVHTDRVEEWIPDMEQTKGDFLINRILPECLREHNIPRSARGWMPAWVDDNGIVWWHPGKLSDWWMSHRRGPFSERERNFGAPSALENFRISMGLGREDRKKFQINHTEDKYAQQNYYPVPIEMSKQIIDQIV